MRIVGFLFRRHPLSKTWMLNVSVITLCSLGLSNCTDNTNNRIPTEWEPIEIPVFASSPNHLIEEVIYSSAPDSIWQQDSSSGKWFKFVIPDTLPQSKLSGACLHFLGETRMSSGFLSILDPNQNETALRWDYFIAIEMSDLRCYMVPDSLAYEYMSNTREIVGSVSHLDPLRLRVVRYANEASAFELGPRNVLIIPVTRNGMTSFLIRTNTGRIKEIDTSGKVIDEWPGEVEGWADAVIHENMILLYQANGRTPFAFDPPGGVLKKYDKQTGVLTTVAVNNSLPLTGIAIVGESLFAVGYDRIRSRSILYSFDLNLLFSSQSFESSMFEFRLLDYQLNGPLSTTSDGKLLGIYQTMKESALILLDNNGDPYGQWIVPFYYIIQAHFDGSRLYLSAATIRSDAFMVSEEQRFQVYPLILQHSALWSFAVSIDP